MASSHPTQHVHPDPKELADLEIPSVDCPFDSHTSEEPDQLVDTVDRWARDFGLVEDDESVCAQTAGLQFARCVHPQATGPEREFVAKWYSWGFLEDDSRDEPPAVDASNAVAGQRQFVDVVAGGDCDDQCPPLVRAFADLRRQWCSLGTRRWRARFDRHHLRYFLSHVWETANRAEGHVPVREEYVRWTRIAAGLPLVFDMTALTSGLDRSPALYRSRSYRGLLRAAANVICWTNDLHSLKRELLDGDVNNLVLVVSVERDCPLDEAAEAVADAVAEETAAFQRLAGEVAAAFDREGLTEHITQLQCAIGGHLKYSRETNRYDVS